MVRKILRRMASEYLVVRQKTGLVAHCGERTSFWQENRERKGSFMEAVREYRYNRLTWEEMNEAIAAQKVVVLPTGSTEQHGPHLPLDVDTFLVESVCLELGRRMPDAC